MTNQNVVVPDAKQGIDITIAMALPKSLFSPVVPKPLPAAPGGYFTITRKRFSKKTETGGKISSWVDSMRDSSPTRVKSTTSLSETEEKKSWIVSVQRPSYYLYSYIVLSNRSLIFSLLTLLIVLFLCEFN
jgi:trehalose 6-phosphate phosphatase